MKGAERESREREQDVLTRVAPVLENGKAIREMELADEDEKAIRNFGFLSAKPVLIVVNLGDNNLDAGPDLELKIREKVGSASADVIAIPAQIEMEIGQLGDDAAEFRDSMGIGPSRLGEVVENRTRCWASSAFSPPGRTRSAPGPSAGAQMPSAQPELSILTLSAASSVPRWSTTTISSPPVAWPKQRSAAPSAWKARPTWSRMATSSMSTSPSPKAGPPRHRALAPNGPQRKTSRQEDQEHAHQGHDDVGNQKRLAVIEIDSGQIAYPDVRRRTHYDTHHREQTPHGKEQPACAS